MTSIPFSRQIFSPRNASIRGLGSLRPVQTPQIRTAALWCGHTARPFDAAAAVGKQAFYHMRRPPADARLPFPEQNAGGREKIKIVHSVPPVLGFFHARGPSGPDRPNCAFLSIIFL
jgi:hypothetical protein